MFIDKKSPLASLGIIGGSGAVVLGLAQIGGWAISPADAAELSDAFKGIAVSVAGILAVYGRYRATKRIGLD
tara:strand:- start:330 stop:545 length:216 start_codon:yes stop_codon:yes gene_type:complete